MSGLFIIVCIGCGLMDKQRCLLGRIRRYNLENYLLSHLSILNDLVMVWKELVVN